MGQVLVNDRSISLRDLTFDLRIEDSVTSVLFRPSCLPCPPCSSGPAGVRGASRFRHVQEVDAKRNSTFSDQNLQECELWWEHTVSSPIPQGSSRWTSSARAHVTLFFCVSAGVRSASVTTPTARSSGCCPVSMTTT